MKKKICIKCKVEKEIEEFFKRKLRLNIRSLIGSSIRNAGFRKSQLRLKKTEAILCCKIDEFMKYIESKFLEGMNWENRGEWHIDHMFRFKPIWTFSV